MNENEMTVMETEDVMGTEEVNGYVMEDEQGNNSLVAGCIGLIIGIAGTLLVQNSSKVLKKIKDKKAATDNKVKACKKAKHIEKPDSEDELEVFEDDDFTVTFKN